MTDAPQNPNEGSTDSTESLEQTQARLTAEGGVETPAKEEVHTGASFKRSPVVVGVVAALAVGAIIGGVSGAGVTMWATSNNASSSPVVGSANPTTITVGDATTVLVEHNCNHNPTGPGC